MALLWADNFQMYGLVNTAAVAAASTERMLNGSYAEINNIGSGLVATRLVPDPDPSGTGKPVLRMVVSSSSGSLGRVRKVLPAASGVVGTGMRLWLDKLPVPSENLPEIGSYRNSSAQVLTTIAVNQNGNILAYRGDSETGTLLGQTAGPVIVANAWQHIETKIVFDDTAGSVEVRVEGVTVLNLTNVNTSAGSVPCSQVGFAKRNTTAANICQPHFKDFVVWDNNGTYNNNFLGSVFVYSLVPDSDEALNWTPVGAANGWSILDNVPPVDTNYIEAGSTPPAPYRATLTNLPPDVTSVKGIVAVVRSRKVDGGDGNLRVSLLSGSANAPGANRPITAAFTYWADVFEEDPATAAAWTPSGVDAARIQLDRTV